MPLLTGASIVIATTGYSEGDAGPIAVFVFLLGTGVLGCTIMRAWDRRQTHRLRCWVSVYSLSVIVTCAFYHYNLRGNGTPYLNGDWDDDYRFDTEARQIATTTARSLSDLRAEVVAAGSGTWHAASNYSILLAVGYRLAERAGLSAHPLYPRLLNGFCLALIAVLVSRIALMCGLSAAGSELAGYFVGFSPYMLFSAGHTYRDTLAALGVATFVWGAVSLRRSGREKGLLRLRAAAVAGLGLLAGGVVASSLRDGYIAVLVATLGLSLCLWVGPRRRAFLVAGIGAMAGLAIVGARFTGGELEYEATRRLDYYHSRHSDSDGNVTGVIFRMSYPASLPFRLALRNVAPLPIPQDKAPETFARVGTIIWFLTLPFLVRAGLASFRREGWARAAPLRTVAVSFAAFYALNVATTLQDRHIVMYLPMACVLIVAHLDRGAPTGSRDVVLMTAIGVLLAAAYLARGLFL